jgi:hypothetical protein
MKPQFLKKILLFLVLNASFITVFSQVKASDKLPKLDVVKANAIKRYSEEIKVIIYFPKKSITKEQLNEILKPENLVIQTSSVPLTYTSECKENLIQNNFTISNCWTRNSKNTAVSAITNVYQLVENNNADFYTVEATLDYRGLAPRTSLISFFIDKRYFQSIKAGNWKVQDKTLCHLEIPENRWSEFAYQEGAGFRGFAVRGFCGENSICSTLSKTQNVEFWIEAPH